MYEKFINFRSILPPRNSLVCERGVQYSIKYESIIATSYFANSSPPPPPPSAQSLHSLEPECVVRPPQQECLNSRYNFNRWCSNPIAPRYSLYVCSCVYEDWPLDGKYGRTDDPSDQKPPIQFNDGTLKEKCNLLINEIISSKSDRYRSYCWLNVLPSWSPSAQLFSLACAFGPLHLRMRSWPRRVSAICRSYCLWFLPQSTNLLHEIVGSCSFLQKGLSIVGLC